MEWRLGLEVCTTADCEVAVWGLQLAQVRNAAASLERVAGAMARQAADDSHPGRTSYTVGPVDGRRPHDGRRRSF
jgi:hypothetical protein